MPAYIIFDANGNYQGSGYASDALPLPNGSTPCTVAQLDEAPLLALQNGVIVSIQPPPPSAPSLAQQATTLMDSGIIITSVGTSSLNGTYAVDPTSISHFTAEFLSLVATSAFCDGSQSVAWPDTTGGLHTFTVAQFKPFALAASAFVAGALKCINGSSTTLPPATVTIP